MAMGAYWALIFGTSAFGFWYGAKMIADGLDRRDIGCGHGINGGRGTGMSGNQAARIGLCFDAGKASGVFIDVVCAAYFVGRLLPMLSLRIRVRTTATCTHTHMLVNKQHPDTAGTNTALRHAIPSWYTNHVDRPSHLSSKTHLRSQLRSSSFAGTKSAVRDSQPVPARLRT